MSLLRHFLLSVALLCAVRAFFGPVLGLPLNNYDNENALQEQERPQSQLSLSEQHPEELARRSASWTTLAALPDALGEVAAAYIGGTIYLVGQGTSNTYAYSVASNSWTSSLAQRPYVGDHHAVVLPGDGNMWLVGGFDGGSEGMIQVYYVSQNSWSSFAMPSNFGGPGSVSAVVVSGVIYFCGGIDTSSNTVNTCGTYTISSGAFGSMPSMPRGVNHAAYATDGSRFFIIGGRTGPNVPSPGFNTVQIYTFSTGSWDSSDTNPNIAPLPVPRGGMGTGVFIGGSIYVIGGETSASSPPNGVYTNVNIYNTGSNSWSTATSLPSGRHGIYPVTDGSYIYVFGGGTQDGFSQSQTAEKLAIASGGTPPTTTTTTAVGATTKKTTTTTTKKTTTTSSSSQYCGNSGANNIMVCRDSYRCDVTTSSLGWGCCSNHGGRKYCPANKPVMCSDRNCGGDYCCDYSTSQPLCGGYAPLAPSQCP